MRMDNDKFRDEHGDDNSHAVDNEGEDAPVGEDAEGGGGSTTLKNSLGEELWSLVKPYKREIIAKQMIEFEPGEDRRAAIINSLRDMGVKVFIIEAKSIETTGDILHHVLRVIDYVSRENQMYAAGSLDDAGEPVDPLGFQRCLLYQDRTGRLFNLVIADHAVGPVARFEDLLTSFSGLQAMVATVILCRSFPCAVNDIDLDVLSPARLSLILGLVFTEEISLSYTFAQMFVRATPSISAHTLTTFVDSDLLRKAVIMALAVAPSASTKSVQGYITLGGISLAIALFLSNLGSRSWHFMGWKPLAYQGPFAGPLAFLASTGMGIVFPYMGHRKIHVGGRPAVEHVILSAVFVAILFMVSDIDKVQQYLVVGSEQCSQDYVNIIIGAWWAFTFLSSLFMAMSIPSTDETIPQEPEDEEPLLEHDHASPVGYRVPALPNFEVDPSTADIGIIPLCPTSVQMVVGVVLAIVFGGGMIYLGLIDDDDDFWGRRLLELAP